MKTLSNMSRDEESDLLVIAQDAMSNKFSKLPMLIERPKCITDADRFPLDVNTVQVSRQYGSYIQLDILDTHFTGPSEYTNYDYILLNGLYPHDSSFNASLIIDTLTKVIILIITSPHFLSGNKSTIPSDNHLRLSEE
uniref:Reverse transcriptase domain-containing protein n=1 Tax=Caenorhabditis tropicalis TaxID=1561998 RepID=A0A1I7TIQ0_9PELO